MNNSEDQNNPIELFSILGIEQIVCVDDQYRTLASETLNDIIGICAANGTEKIEALAGTIPQLRNVLFSEDEDIWQMQLRQLWETLDDENRKIIYSSVEDDSSKDRQAAEGLKGLLLGAPGIQYQELSFSQWKEQKEQYLTDESSARTLFLFDRDLSKDGGTSNGGINSIKKILEDCPNATCGLLSHTFEADEEVSKWDSFADEYDLDRNRFMPISKTYFSEDKMDDFLQRLKLVALNKHCEELRNSVSGIIRKTYEDSRLEIDNLNIYDFEHIVFRSSYNEGIWEPDTLLRLHGLFHRNTLREMARKNSDLQKLTNKIRRISLLPSDRPKSDTSWKIRRLELYEDESHINGMHMPLELGDIFEKTVGGKKFILLAQPCDLMVRDGKRKHTVFESLLAEIVKSPDPPIDQQRYYKLSYFGKEKGEEHYVDFNNMCTVKLCHLDLCVFQPDGSAMFSMGQECPKGVIPSWEKYFKNLKKDFEKIIKHYKVLEGLLKDAPKVKRKQFISMAVPKSTNEKQSLLKGNIRFEKGKATLSYNFRRVGRLCQPQAGDMLMQYARKMSRMAFEHDFAREETNE